jgi:hypothetical protein
MEKARLLETLKVLFPYLCNTLGVKQHSKDSCLSVKQKSKEILPFPTMDSTNIQKLLIEQ